MATDLEETPLAEGVICGVTRKVGGNIEWVCIDPPHDTEKQKSSQESALGYHPKSERHYMVNRYPDHDRFTQTEEQDSGA